MKIGELAAKTGLAASRIRFYERMGLLQLVERQANGYRSYPAEAVLVLNLIKSAQEAGFSLDELRKLMPADLNTWEHGTLDRALRDKISSIEALQRRLEQNKATLLAVLEQIEAKPEDMSCAANARRVLSNMGLDGEGGEASPGLTAKARNSKA
jgi:DNA-binding transcriptional MerR regulator